MSKPTLNIGCGPDTWGDVRLDIGFRTQTGMRSVLNVMADAHFLPFIDKSFGHVRCWHVLEHISNPTKAIQEIRRVGEAGNIRFPLDDGYKRETLRGILALSPRSVYYAFLTRRNHFHLWILKPKGTQARKNSFEILPALRKGRKAKVFKRIPLPRIANEWEIVF
ncbi:MAG TPA: methyltransferase domain-containing protein [Candidatus Bathyarchaeia archaeon]